MVSVCMATYNGGKYLHEQIDSIINQLDDNDELIISDDGSTDSTVSIIESYKDKRIKLLKNKNHGINSNFENALIHSKGDYICLSDQDDIWLEGKIAFIKKALLDCDLVVHNAEIIDGNGKSKGYDYFSYMHKGNGFWANWWKTRFLGCCMSFNRKLLNDVLPFPRKVVGHDYWIGMLGAAKYKVLFDNTIYLSYRRHGNNASPSAEKSDNSLYYKLFEKRIPILWSIIIRYLHLG